VVSSHLEYADRRERNEKGEKTVSDCHGNETAAVPAPIRDSNHLRLRPTRAPKEECQHPSISAINPSHDTLSQGDLLHSLPASGQLLNQSLKAFGTAQRDELMVTPAPRIAKKVFRSKSARTFLQRNGHEVI